MHKFLGGLCVVMLGCLSCNQHSEATEVAGSLFKNLSLEQFMVAYGQEPRDSAMLIDLRTPPEFDDGFIKGAVMINFLESDFAHQLDLLDRNKSYYIYCQQGGRSEKCMDKMKSMGFKRVYTLDGGYDAYSSMNSK